VRVVLLLLDPDQQEHVEEGAEGSMGVFADELDVSAFLVQQ